VEEQRGGSFWAANYGGEHAFTITKQIDNRDIFSEVALTYVSVMGEDNHLSSVGISQIVSDSGVENFDWPYKKVIFRTNVTSITFRIDVYQSSTAARWMVYYWS
jgi:hypothetical protein